MLIIPTNDDSFQVESDTLDFAVGAILSQKQKGKQHLVVYFSQSMSQIEHNYAIYNKKMLAIMLVL